MDALPTGFLEAWWRFDLSTLYDNMHVMGSSPGYVSKEPVT